MPSRSPRSRSRSPSRRHKKSHKRSRRSSSERSPTPSTPNVPIKKEEGANNENGANSIYKPRLPSVMVPPAVLAKLDIKDDDKSRSPIGDQSPGKDKRLTSFNLIYF